MKKQSAFLSAALMVLTIALTAFFMAGCGNGDDDDSSGSGTLPDITAPRIGDLPAFPTDANPAETEAAADSILTELKQSYLIVNVYDRVLEVIRDSRSGNNYNLKDLEDDEKTVKISASKKITAKESEGFKKIEDYDYDYDTLLNTNDYIRYSIESKIKGKVTTAITSENVIIVAGSTIEEQMSGSQNISVTTGGTIKEAKGKENTFLKFQQISGFTVTTPLGSVKIILDLTSTQSLSISNISIFDIFHTEFNMDYSGSLKVYGKDNVLLKTVPVTDKATYQQAQRLIGFRDDEYDDK